MVDEYGQPVTDAVVALDGEDSWRGNRCREDGTFRYARLKPGTYRLLAGREGVRWEDPVVQTQTVQGGTEGLVVRIPTPFFEPAGDERQIPLETVFPAARELAERSANLLCALSNVEALQTLNEALRHRRAPILRARGVWPRQASTPWPDAPLRDADIEGYARVVPSAGTFGLLVTKEPIALPLAAFLGDTTAFAVGRRRNERDDAPLPGPALAVVAPLRPGTEPATLEAWLTENRKALSKLSGYWRTPCYAVVDGHLVLTNDEAYLMAFLNTFADAKDHPPLAANATFAAVSGDHMRGAHAYAFLDVAARYRDFEQEYAELLRNLRGHALTLAFHVSKRFVHGELVVYLDPPEAPAVGDD